MRSSAARALLSDARALDVSRLLDRWRNRTFVAPFHECAAFAVVYAVMLELGLNSTLVANAFFLPRYLLPKPAQAPDTASAPATLQGTAG